MNVEQPKIWYPSEERPAVQAAVYPVCEGVWYIWVDWCTQLSWDGTGNDEDDNYQIFLGDYNDIVVAVSFPGLKDDGFLFGSQSRKSFHGTYYTAEKYHELVKDGCMEGVLYSEREGGADG